LFTKGEAGPDNTSGAGAEVSRIQVRLTAEELVPAIVTWCKLKEYDPSADLFTEKEKFPEAHAWDWVDPPVRWTVAPVVQVPLNVMEPEFE
jgi:hypothetical protein